MLSEDVLEKNKSTILYPAAAQQIELFLFLIEHFNLDISPYFNDDDYIFL
jgi:hypothetical protein